MDLLKNKSFKKYSYYFILLTFLSHSLLFLFADLNETRSFVVGLISVLLLIINCAFFIKYKDSSLYNFDMDFVIKKEPSFIYLFFAGFALGLLSDSSEPLILSSFLSCAMLSLKYLIMHLQYKGIIKGI